MIDIGNLNLKIPIILAISTFMSSLKFMLCCVEHEKSSIASVCLVTSANSINQGHLRM